jgi:hypothetical protein
MSIMRRPKITVALAAIASIWLLAGCAAGGGGTHMATEAGLQCPKGFTVTCEVRKIGRIHHGTFAKSLESCACVSNTMHSQTVPVIP